MGYADPIEVPSGAGDLQAYTGQGLFKGYSIRESAGAAGVATVILRDGTSTSGEIIAVIDLPADGYDWMWCEGGILLKHGLFVDRVAGSTEGAVYIG